MRTQAPRSSNRRAYINANIVAPAQNLNGKGGTLIEDGWILQCGPKVTRESVGASTTVVDCSGLTLVPGLIDMRVFTGEPGHEYRETLQSAGDAAAAGGVTSFVLMPDTTPAVDDGAIVDFIIRRAAATAKVNASLRRCCRSSVTSIDRVTLNGWSPSACAATSKTLEASLAASMLGSTRGNSSRPSWVRTTS